MLVLTRPAAVAGSRYNDLTSLIFAFSVGLYSYAAVARTVHNGSAAGGYLVACFGFVYLLKFI